MLEYSWGRAPGLVHSMDIVFSMRGLFRTLAMCSLGGSMDSGRASPQVVKQLAGLVKLLLTTLSCLGSMVSCGRMKHPDSIQLMGTVLTGTLSAMAACVLPQGELRGGVQWAGA
jgi:hypothetical protein